MGRGKIEIKRIENDTSRQVTFSKRKNGLFKKAHELTLLCDAQVSIILISNTRSNRQHEYCSPSTTHKQIYDRYQQVLEVPLWSNHYERMQNELKSQMEKNECLNRKIRQRMGKDLSGLTYNDLLGLEQKAEKAVNVIRMRKVNQIQNQTQKFSNRCKRLVQENNQKLQEIYQKYKNYGLMRSGAIDYKTDFDLENQASQIFAFLEQPACQPKFDDAAYKTHDYMRSN